MPVPAELPRRRLPDAAREPAPPRGDIGALPRCSSTPARRKEETGTHDRGRRTISSASSAWPSPVRLGPASCVTPLRNWWRRTSGSAGPIVDPSAQRSFVFRVAGRSFPRVPCRRVGRGSRSTRSDCTTTRSRTTAGTATSTSPSSSSRTTSDDGDVLVDYSGGTGILLDRLRLRVVRPPVRRCDRRQLPEVPARRGREVPQRPAGRVPAAALPQGREAALSTWTKCSAEDFPGADVLVSTNAIHLYDRSRGHPPCVGACVLKPDGRVRDQLRQRPQPARGGQRVDHRRDGVRRPRGRAGTRTGPTRAGTALPQRARRSRSECARIASSGATASSSRRGRSSTTSTRSEQRASWIEDVTERAIEANVHEWYEFLAAYADAVLGWAGGTEKR